MGRQSPSSARPDLPPRRFTVLRVLGAGMMTIITGVAAMVLQFNVFAPRMESQLQQDVTSALKDSRIEVVVQGRDVRLKVRQLSDTQIDQAIDTARAVPGVRAVTRVDHVG